jgi:glycine oxidase
LPPLRVLVAGAGALGSCLAVMLARAGARVTLADPSPLGANASGVAAGMLAPAFECLFDPQAPDLGLLRRARDLWPDFARSIGVALDRSGAMAVGRPEDLDAWEGRMSAVGVAATRLDPDQARARSPWLAFGPGGLWTPEDWRLDAAAALAALRAAAHSEGVCMIAEGVAAFDAGRARLSNGEIIIVDAMAIATGASRSLIAAAPELEVLTPIKGHILRAAGVDLAGPVVRVEEGYICPAPGGALIGATMEAGEDDVAIDPAAVASLRKMAGRVMAGLGDTPMVAAAGVRAATPDGLPLAGPSRRDGVWLAVGARRNGWLLAPLIVQGLVRCILGGAAEAIFDPGRFGV